MSSKWLPWVGFAWPILVAGVVAAFCWLVKPEQRYYETLMPLVAFLSLFAAPGVCVCLYTWMPRYWCAEMRILVAILLTVPIACLQAYAALCVFVWATFHLGWVE